MFIGKEPVQSDQMDQQVTFKTVQDNRNELVFHIIKNYGELEN